MPESLNAVFVSRMASRMRPLMLMFVSSVGTQPVPNLDTLHSARLVHSTNTSIGSKTPLFSTVELNAVGIVVGDEVGLPVGLSLGSAVGSLVGNTVGNMVGNTVGTEVGLPVGILLGTAVGSVVGLFVGVLDGSSVGRALGMAVGAVVVVLFVPSCKRRFLSCTSSG